MLIGTTQTNRSDGIVYSGSIRRCHSDYRDDLVGKYERFDIAMVKTSEKIAFGKTVAPLKLNRIKTIPSKSFIFAGWGALKVSD